jgi:hypothetical protein
VLKTALEKLASAGVKHNSPPFKTESVQSTAPTDDLITTGDPQELALAAWSTVHRLSVLLFEDQPRYKVGEVDPEGLARAFARMFYARIAKQ